MRNFAFRVLTIKVCNAPYANLLGRGQSVLAILKETGCTEA